MIKSMFSAVTGLRSHQTMLDVIGNNIANVNTQGFKSSRVLFKDIYYQTTSSASQPTVSMGGQNANQIGYGAAVASIDVIATRSGYQQTSQPLDMYISGDGYFAVQDPNGDRYFTRVGSFAFDASGTLVDSHGNHVLGRNMSKITVPNFNLYSDISISKDGSIRATDSSTNSIVELNMIQLASFANPAGLIQEGNQYVSQSANSGTPQYNTPGMGVAGSLVSGGLEMSNVDLSKEFTDMIVAQRGFQANSRVITTSDSVLEELVNIKR